MHAVGLRATGKEFWPSGLNVLEALKSRSSRRRIRLLTTLGELAGDNHALPLPTEGLRIVAETLAAGGRTIEWADPRLTRFFREPETITDEEADYARQHLLEEEQGFWDTHERAKTALQPLFRSEGGLSRWPTVRHFLDEVWSTPEHLQGYIHALWAEWNFEGPPPVAAILAHQSWQLFFDGWGAAVWARSIAEPQPRWVQSADLQQLVYFGSALGRVLATEDAGFRHLATAILQGKYHLARVVSLNEIIA
jgi:hypothetical protein